MSARWRRSKKNLKKFDTFTKPLKKLGKNTHRIFKIKNSQTKRDICPSISVFPRVYRKRGLKEPEPLIDIIDDNNEIIVVAEFAGFNTEDLKVQMKNQRLTLSAQALNRKYHKSLNLPAQVIPNSMRIKSKNGVLEIRLKKIIKEKTVDKMAGLENAA